MPRLPKNYTKNVIYKLVCNDLSIKECYVGHTTNFTQRKACHKTRCHNENGEYYNLKIYQTIRENGGWDNYSMIEIEKYPCRDENDATARERHWFEILNSGLNTNVPNRSRAEHYTDNRAEIAIWHRQYREDNRAEIRQYREDHKEEMAIQQRQYKADHKEEIATKRKKTFNCECGEIGTVHHKSRHLKIKFHLQYIERIMSSTDSTIPVVPPQTNIQLTCGICYIPLAQFENTKQQEEMNDDHFYMSNHYDFMYQH
jgi:hypothetical protein